MAPEVVTAPREWKSISPENEITVMASTTLSSPDKMPDTKASRDKFEKKMAPSSSQVKNNAPEKRVSPETELWVNRKGVSSDKPPPVPAKPMKRSGIPEKTKAFDVNKKGNTPEKTSLVYAEVKKSTSSGDIGKRLDKRRTSLEKRSSIDKRSPDYGAGQASVGRSLEKRSSFDKKTPEYGTASKSLEKRSSIDKSPENAAGQKSSAKRQKSPDKTGKSRSDIQRRGSGSFGKGPVLSSTTASAAVKRKPSMDKKRTSTGDASATSRTSADSKTTKSQNTKPSKHTFV
jgi:hypothetical protein